MLVENIFLKKIHVDSGSLQFLQQGFNFFNDLFLYNKFFISYFLLRYTMLPVDGAYSTVMYYFTFLMKLT